MSGLTTLKISYYVDGKDSGTPQSCCQDVPAHRADSEHGCNYAWAARVAAEKLGIHADRVNVIDIDNIG